MTSKQSVHPRAAATPQLEDACARQQATRALAECLAGLKEREREAVLLFSEGLSWQEIGDEVGFTRQYAHMLVTAALGKLRKEIMRRGIQCTGDVLFGEPSVTKRAVAVQDERIAQAA